MQTIELHEQMSKDMAVAIAMPIMRPSYEEVREVIYLALRVARRQGIEEVLAYLDKEGISHNGFAGIFEKKNANWIRTRLGV